MRHKKSISLHGPDTIRFAQVYNNLVPKKLNTSNSPSDYADSFQAPKKMLIPSSENQYPLKNSIDAKPQLKKPQICQDLKSKKAKFTSLSIKSLSGFNERLKIAKKIAMKKNKSLKEKDMSHRISVYNKSKFNPVPNPDNPSGFGMGFKIERLDPICLDITSLRPKMNFFKTSAFPHIKYNSTRQNYNDKPSERKASHKKLTKTSGKTTKQGSKAIFKGFTAGNGQNEEEKNLKDFCPNIDIVNGLKHLMAKNNQKPKSFLKPEFESSFPTYKTSTARRGLNLWLRKDSSVPRSESAFGGLEIIDPLRSSQIIKKRKRN
ncbi:unnamed protein product [Moneuplotes crassus]|uniref:Uncharacterized protein n=1 Tax=Euplotes crassus TaxID=5936 RepID=A0AAD1Y8G3_EUPCR|nr:unnamed protein product [Moneuplotes crassus]